MIKIEEGLPTKMPGLSSLYISFNYNPDVVEIVKNSLSYNYDKNTHIWEVPVTELSKLLDMLTSIDDIQLNFLKEKSKSAKPIEVDISKYKTKPYDYQKDGIEYGLQKGHEKFLLLDAPGLGKSLQLIYLAQELKEREGLEHCLVICGINTLKNNWKKEIKQHSDLSCRILGERVTKQGKIKIGSVKDRLEDLKHPLEEFIIITNIETLRNDDIVKELTKGKANKFDMIILDEAHACKNPKSKQGANLLKLKNADHMVGATGTLLLNDPADAYVPLKWIGKESANFSTFKHYYYNYGGDFGKVLLGFRNINILKDQIERYSLRRTKELLDLPPKTVIDEYVEMSDEQSTFYNAVKQGIKDQVDKVELKATNVLSLVSRLRQATACPSILTTENIPSAKLDRAVDLCQQIVDNGDKVVIFSTFKESLKPLYEQLVGYRPVVCTGDVSDSVINDNIKIFQEDKNCKVMLATWQKMGTGITLTAASYMIFLDTPWTSGVFLQAQDRIHRIGAKDPVFIYHLITKDTIDERVLEIVNDKQAISEYIVDDKVSPNTLANLKKYIEDLE